jgi:hypothetical protein
MFLFKNWLAGNKGIGKAYLINFTMEHTTEHQAKPESEPIGVYGNTRVS